MYTYSAHLRYATYNSQFVSLSSWRHHSYAFLPRLENKLDTAMIATDLQGVRSTSIIQYVIRIPTNFYNSVRYQDEETNLPVQREYVRTRQFTEKQTQLLPLQERPVTFMQSIARLNGYTNGRLPHTA